MVREFMEASKKAGIDHNGGIVNQRGNSRHVTGDLNKLVAMANASSNTAAAAAAAAAAGNNNKGGGNNTTNGQAKNTNTSRGKVTGVKIVRQTVPFVGPPPPPGHASSNAQKGGGPQKPVAMGVSATFSKADGSTATVDLDAAAIASMMSQANSNNPEAFNAGLKQILAAASSAAAAQQSSSSSGSSSQQQQQNKQSAEASYNAMSALSASCPVGKRNALLANKIASSYGSLGGEDDNSKSTSSSSSGGNSKTSSKKKSSSSNNTAQQQHQQNTAQIQSLFSSLFNMAQQMDTSGSSSSSTTPSQESIQNDFASFRKAAFVAGVNVAIQQEAEREAQHEMEKMNQQQKQKSSTKQQEAVQQQKSVKQKQQPKSKKKEGASASSATATAKSNVFSMIFGGGGSSKSKASSSSATTSSTTSSTNKNGSSTTSTNSASAAAVVPIIPPPPGGFPQDSLVAQAASVLADYGTNASDDDENLNLAVSLGNRLLKSVNMSLDTEDDARRAYEKVTSCLSAEERNIVDSFATNFADLPDDGGVGGGFGCLPEELLNVMSKSMASVMNLDNPGVMERLAQEMDRVKKVSATTTPPPQDRPTFEHLPDDDKTRQHKNEQEAAAREKAKAEEEERKRQEEAEEEERKRELKASKRRDKKARQKERLKKEAELKAAAAAIKKRERTITSWRSRVIAACASGDARKMNMLIGESPYRNFTFTLVLKEGGDEETNDDGPKNQEEYLLQQLNWFLPNCLQKYQTRGGASFDALPFEFNVARELLAKYIISTSFDVFREPVPTYSRTCIHSAAYANDVDFIKWVLQSSNDNEKGFLETPCTDAGWTPLHYATAGGAKSALELLMAEKCNVKARSNPSLTCFRTFTPYQSSNGLTARELAVVLQAGAVDDDLTSKAAILDEIVDKRIVNVTAADKTSYMRILKAIEERLKEVEKNGYWPLPEDEEQIALIFEETPSESTTSAALKKKSKKKNKKKAKETNPPPAPPAASPEPEVAKGKSSSGDDLSDPVAVALLGMGFSEEQIKAAAKAFGGYVGADDMVMWILSGGDTSSTDQSDTNSQQNSQARSKDSVSITSSTKSFTTKAQTKALTRAQKKVEEAARKHQEEIANAQKAAAKREEQRRLRREWNEREQARQQEEKDAKLAKALERQRQAEMEKMMADIPKGPPGPGGIPMSINIGGGGGGGKGGPPMTIVAGGKKSSKKSNMGIPQAPTVKAPKILARPSDASKGSAGNQPLFTKPAASSKSSSRASKPGNPSTHQPTMILKKGAKPPPATKGISASAPEFRPPGVSDGSISSAGSAGKQTFPVQKSVAKKVVPPGFQPAMPGKASDQPAATPYVEPNHMGLIRATAREFVPSFAPSPMSEENVVPSMSAQSSGKQAPAPQPTASSNESASNAPAAAASLIEPMSSLLSKSSSPAPPTTLTQTVGVDPTVSAASSITGLSGTLSEEKPPTSRVGSIMTFESNTATGGGLQGSSILESISYGATADHHQSNGLGNIWGGAASNTNQTDTLGGLGGFDFSSFMQDDALSGSKNDNGDTKGNTSSLGGNALGNTTWGGNGAIGGDSIW